MHKISWDLFSLKGNIETYLIIKEMEMLVGQQIRQLN
ncbi:YqzL family protein [Halobacillus shinanisalinarum]|uniref:YqzL family protein n=1 Tax=Halobacillus shinanisalinarum TaxID=2932258 RepID=A0ABY4H4I0_9BACI|nr:YqzL family protein [Halobacillus shinanisalinarum]UOQ95121.1 YqzL family protein [Halobacillus shinanisalinarum]